MGNGQGETRMRAGAVVAAMAGAAILLLATLYLWVAIELGHVPKDQRWLFRGVCYFGMAASAAGLVGAAMRRRRATGIALGVAAAVLASILAYGQVLLPMLKQA
jgi:hypothetical protein